MSFRYTQAAQSQATELLRSLFSKVFGVLFGNIVRKFIRASTRSVTRRPNESPNSMKTTRSRFVGRSLATPPPAQSVTKVGRCSPIPPSQRLDGGIGEHLQLEGPGAGGGVARNQPGQDRNRLGQER